MSVFKTLSELKNKIDRPASSGGGKRFLSLKNGEQYTIRFLQELTLDSKNYNEERSTALVVPIHQNPLNFRKKAVCTADGDGCWACEQIPMNSKWRATNHLLISVAVKDSDGNWSSQIIDTTFGSQKIGNDLLEYASAYRTLTDRTYKYARTGSGLSDTKYTLIPLQESREPSEFEDLELADLHTVFTTVAYGAQEDFYMEEDEPTGKQDPTKSW